jgi:hypothetical protein
MHRSHKTALGTLQLIALQLFVALACATAATANGPRSPREARTSDSTVSHLKTHLSVSNSTAAQRRRARRLRRADALLPGIWGGEHMRFEVTDAGARIDLDCAHASVESRIFVDGAGRFSVWGTYYHEHGGPVREEEEARGERVRLTGRVGGSLLKLTVTRGATQVGTYTLTRDREARVVKCR